MIVIYGINNLGKSTQAKRLVDRLKFIGKQAEYIKYPRYDLWPSGHLINSYLRHGNPHHLSSREIQITQILNRTQYQQTLETKLNQGTWVVAEDYVGTGIAWGMGGGVDQLFLEQLNSHLIKEDISFLFEGERFSQSLEKNHTHEQNSELTNKTKQAFHTLGQQYGWITINANQPLDSITEELWKHIARFL